MVPSVFFLNAGVAGESVIEDSNAFKVHLHQCIMAVNYFGVLAFIEFWETLCQERGGLILL